MVEVSREPAGVQQVTQQLLEITGKLGPDTTKDQHAALTVAFSELSMTTPLESSFDPLCKNSRLVTTQSLLLSALVASGATHRVGKAPQGAVAGKLDERRRGKRGGRK